MHHRSFSLVFASLSLANGAMACGGSDGSPSAPGVDASTSDATSDSPSAVDGATPSDGALVDASPATDADARSPQRGCPSSSRGCYTIYAHTDHSLYYVDLTTVSLVPVGPFQAPPATDGGVGEDILVDLAVTPDDVVWVVSTSALYRAEAMTGHVAKVGDIASCGAGNIALTATTTGKLYLGDEKGVFCSLDPATTPPKVTPIGTLTGGLALAGDFATISDGTTFGTAYSLASPASLTNNSLVRIDLSNANATAAAARTGFGKLFGVAFGAGKVFAFTHDGTGGVITIDPSTGTGTPYGRFTDPTTNQPALFQGAGVNPLVSPTP